MRKKKLVVGSRGVHPHKYRLWSEWTRQTGERHYSSPHVIRRTTYFFSRLDFKMIPLQKSNKNSKLSKFESCHENRLSQRLQKCTQVPKMKQGGGSTRNHQVLQTWVATYNVVPLAATYHVGVGVHFCWGVTAGAHNESCSAWLPAGDQYCSLV